jgi:hypothetical protein
MTGSMQVMQELLKESLTKQYALFEILVKLCHGTINKATAHYLVINALPCILHIDNQVGLKILSQLLRIRMDHVKANIVYVDVSSETDQIQTSLTQVEGKMSSAVIRTEERPIILRCPYDANKKQVGMICVDNVQMRRLLKGLMELVNLCIPAVVGGTSCKRLLVFTPMP